jgi:hypothetical protein
MSRSSSSLPNSALDDRLLWARIDGTMELAQRYVREHHPWRATLVALERLQEQLDEARSRSDVRPLFVAAAELPRAQERMF